MSISTNLIKGNIMRINRTQQKRINRAVSLGSWNTSKRIAERKQEQQTALQGVKSGNVQATFVRG